MERLTYFDGGKWRMRIGDTEYSGYGVDRFAAYESTGMEPEDILSAKDMAKIACALHELNQYKELGDIDRLRELVEADRDGRCFIAPIKVGERVFLPNDKKEIIECRVQGISLPAHGKNLIIHLGGYPAEYLWTDREGVDWWKSREAAEAALKGEQHERG